MHCTQNAKYIFAWVTLALQELVVASAVLKVVQQWQLSALTAHTNAFPYPNPQRNSLCLALGYAQAFPNGA